MVFAVVVGFMVGRLTAGALETALVRRAYTATSAHFETIG